MLQKGSHWLQWKKKRTNSDFTDQLCPFYLLHSRYSLYSLTVRWSPPGSCYRTDHFSDCDGCENVPANLQLQGANWPLLLLLLSRFSRVRLLATPRTAAHQGPPQTSANCSLEIHCHACSRTRLPQPITVRSRNDVTSGQGPSPSVFLPSALTQGQAQIVIWHLFQLFLAQFIPHFFFPHRLLLSKVIHTILTWYLPSRRPRLTPTLFIHLPIFPLAFAAQIRCVPHDYVHNFPFPSILVETYSFQYSLYLPQPKYVSFYQSVPLGCVFIFAK